MRVKKMNTADETTQGVNTEKLTITLMPAEDDQPLYSPAYQHELKDLSIAFEAQGVKISYVVELEESAGPSQSPLLGTYMIDLAKAAGLMIGPIVGAWLQARYGRKARLKIGDIEAEARTPEEVEKLIARASRFRPTSRGNDAQN
jgi:hypothetical protein